VGNGTATIFVASGSAQGSKLVRVVPDYQGAWAGRYQVATCTSDGIVRSAGICTTSPRVGDTLPISASLTQTGDQVVGTVSLGTITSPTLTTGINADGGIIVSAIMNSDNVARINASFNLNQVTQGQITGVVSTSWLATGGFPGSANFSGPIVSGGRATQSIKVQSVMPFRPATSVGDLVRRLVNLP
jgi:hypothetical protein